jgi:putative toxin-antitoxin system antitoxin component (TIGR02293 family)
LAEVAISEQETNRLLRVARVTQYAVAVFGSQAKAKAWLTTPSPQLEGLAPLALLGSDHGAEAVIDELTRIEYGDFA